MQYEAFKKELVRRVQEKLGEGVDVTLHRVTKNNGVIWDGLTISKDEKRPIPTIYLEEFYRWHEKGESMEGVIEALLDSYGKEDCLREVTLDYFCDYEKIQDQIYYKLINQEMNKELLVEVPHILFLDLAIVFYYRIEEEQLEGATVLIHNSNLKLWGVTKDQVYQTATLNTPKKMPFTFQGMEEILKTMLKEQGEEEEFQDFVIQNKQKKSEIMYVLTNEEKYFGAACLLYPHVMEHISQLFHSSFFILPSSIHECILVPVSGQYSQNELVEMVTEINETQLDPMEVLSDCVYYYDKEDRVITM